MNMIVIINELDSRGDCIGFFRPYAEKIYNSQTNHHLLLLYYLNANNMAAFQKINNKNVLNNSKLISVGRLLGRMI